MNKSVFTNTGGLKLHQERLQELQDSYTLFNALGFLAGDFSIIEGCVYNNSNNTTSDGVLFINGEVMEFRGGVTQASIIINEQNVNRPYKNGTIQTVHKIRWASFGTGTGSISWAGFQRCYPTRGLEAILNAKASLTAVNQLTARVQTLESINAVFQAAGGVILWMKPASEIPAGWAEYTPLRGKFPVGLDPDDSTFNTLLGQGGSKQVTLSANNLPPHSHPIDSSILKRKDGAAEVIDYGNDVPVKTIAADGVTSTGNNTGGSQPVNILNPHRIVYFIHRIG
ncbi:hypothetical protein FUA48_16030 [Flavobacterium alkalisoli]|uniref:Baseplate structural protein Gp10 C-terminal domain-containing protein n=1 Tax=Flavobacterium alkalisoli TaxID=2602769 RepID=A0A5B9FXF6_9FLAO|nr:hypothetical protein [Flavobacterium alkalisoli]QEE51029.1 hypothetical protein FUA48_16030 [Flavobacterium alkalisoli]